jgi:hypothetical protein
VKWKIFAFSYASYLVGIGLGFSNGKINDFWTVLIPFMFGFVAIQISGKLAEKI